MFIFKNNIWFSDVLDLSGVRHGFSTRLGGVSTEEHTASMNTGFYRGDSDDIVLENIRILAVLSGLSDRVVCTPQIHSDIIRRVGAENVGEGSFKDVPYPCDGFITDEADVTLLVRVADCAPVLLAGLRDDGSPVVCAIHAGWRGSAAGICARAVEMMKNEGCVSISAAIGACIHPCCFQVGEDMRDSVAEKCGRNFADRHIACRGESLYADLPGMNREILLSSGADRVDICPACTACRPDLYHSHRATGGKRGTMGAVIGITGA